MGIYLLTILLLPDAGKRTGWTRTQDGNILLSRRFLGTQSFCDGGRTAGIRWLCSDANATPAEAVNETHTWGPE